MKHIYCILTLILLLISCDTSVSTKTDISIQKTLNYIEKKGSNFELSTGVFLDYLHLKFPEENIPSFLEVYGDLKVFDKEEAKTTRLYKKLVDKNFIFDTNIAEYQENTPINNLQYLMLNSLYCNQISIQDDFFQKIDKQNALGGYFMTHAVLAIHFLEANQCTHQQDLRSIKQTQSKLLKKEIDKPSSNDLQYEAIALLKLIHPATSITPQWVQSIIQAQQEDGGWQRVKSKQKTNDHTTLLALWVLLDSKYPKRQSYNLIKNQ